MNEIGADAVILHNTVIGQELNETEKEENRKISHIRARVEHAFAVMSGQAGRIFQMYVGWTRSQAAIQMINLCYNLKRYETIPQVNLHPLAHA